MPDKLERISLFTMATAIRDHRTILELNGHKPTPQDSKDAVVQAQLEADQKILDGVVDEKDALIAGLGGRIKGYQDVIVEKDKQIKELEEQMKGMVKLSKEEAQALITFIAGQHRHSEENALPKKCSTCELRTKLFNFLADQKE